MSENMLIFISRIAFEYRLSLKNICIIMGMEPTEENKKNIYDLIIESMPIRSNERNRFEYLFNYETINESEGQSKESLDNAFKFLRQYNQFKKADNKEKVQEIMKLLYDTDTKFKQLKETKDFSKAFTQEEQEIISKYRIKHCISNHSIARYLNIDRDRLSQGEQKLENSNLRKKAIMLSEYYEDVTKSIYKRRK